MSKWMLLISLQCLCTKGYSEFTVQPESVVQAEGLKAVFECLYPGAQSHIWGFRGEFYVDVAFPPDITRELPSIDSPARLIIPAKQEYNNSVIQCDAVVGSNNSFERILSNDATLQVQGSLQPVANLHFSKDMSSNIAITISWEAPFSLNLTTVEPDIQYCVDVYNVVEGEDELECNITEESIELTSQCLTDTLYSFYAPSPFLHLYCFEVIARNNINASNGSISRRVSGYIISEPIIIPAEVLSYQIDADLSIKWTFPSSILFVSPRSPPTGYRVELVSIDDPEYPITCSCSAGSKLMNTLITLTLEWCPKCDIQRHRIYNYTITVTNEAGSSTSAPARLSTHDIQSLNLPTLHLQTHDFNKTILEVTCSFLAGSTPSGILVIAYSLTNTSDIHYVVGERAGNQTQVIIDGLSGDVYNVVVYDRGENHLPEERPAGSQTVHVKNQYPLYYGPPNFTSPSLLPTPDITFTEENSQLCIHCQLTLFLNACIVIVHTIHERDVLEQQLQVYSINTNECFSINKEEYHIAVFSLLHDGLKRTPAYTKHFIRKYTDKNENFSDEVQPSNSPTIAIVTIAASGGGLFALIALLLCIIVTGIVCRYRRSVKHKLQLNSNKQVNSKDIFPGIERPNEAYNFAKTFTGKDSFILDMSRVTHVSSRPLPTPFPSPSPVHGIRACGSGICTPSPTHLYEEFEIEPAAERVGMTTSLH